MLKSKKTQLFLILGLIIILKVIFYAATPAEWGDSYRFLRAGEYLSRLSYPKDEKRLPFFPVLLSLGFILHINPLFWGRFLVLILSVACLVVVYKLARALTEKESISILSTLICAFSPPFFYWSSKIMAIILFTFLSSLAFYTYYKKNLRFKLFIIGIICGLAFMTRFEGFLLFLSFFVFFLISRVAITKFLEFLIPFILISFPYFLFRYLKFGTLSTEYFSEPSSFTYSVKILWIYFASLAFLLGFIPFIKISSFRKLFSLNKHLPIILFVVLEFSLALFWQAAIPRLFVPIIPLTAIFVGKSFMELKRKDFNLINFTMFLFVVLFFVVSRVVLKLPFLVTGKFQVSFVLFLNLLAFLFLYLDRFRYSLFFFLLTSFLASVFISFYFRNVYKTVYEAVSYAKKLEGKIAYSDETGVSRWYLRDGKGVYYDGNFDDSREYLWLRENNISYIIDTNEYNEGSYLKVFKNKSYKDNFSIVKVFKSRIGVTETKSVLYKVK